MSSDKWYVNGLEGKYGWSLFPKDSERDQKTRLVDPIASLNVIENLAIKHSKYGEIPSSFNDEENGNENYAFIKKAWETSLIDLQEKKIISDRAGTQISNQDSGVNKAEVETGFFRGYHDICRSLLAITGILEQNSYFFIEKILEENQPSLLHKVVQIVYTLVKQLTKDIICADKIHDRGRVFRRSNGVVVQYIGVGSAFILYSILRALSVLFQHNSDVKKTDIEPIIRTLIIKVLQQIMTQEHIDLESNHALLGIISSMKNDDILQNYQMVGGYVFDECLPGKADAYEFIFFWQSAYALRALLLGRYLAQNYPNKFGWLTSL